MLFVWVRHRAFTGECAHFIYLVVFIPVLSQTIVFMFLFPVSCLPFSLVIVLSSCYWGTLFLDDPIMTGRMMMNIPRKTEIYFLEDEDNNVRDTGSRKAVFADHRAVMILTLMLLMCLSLVTLAVDVDLMWVKPGR